MKPKFQRNSTPFAKSPAAILVCLSMAAAIHTASAASGTWDAGAGTQDWNNAVNWTDDVFPSGAWPAGVQSINTATGLYPVITADPVFAGSDIIIANGGTNSGRLDQTAGNMATGDGNWMFVGAGTSGNATFNLANTAGTGGFLTGFAQGTGSFTTGGIGNNGRFGLGDGGTGTGTLNMNTTGTLHARQGLGVIAGTNGGDGVINLDSGTIDATESWFGDNDANSSGTLNIHGGTYENQYNMLLGRAQGTGTISATGGIINVGGEIMIGEGTSPTTLGTGTITLATGSTLNIGYWTAVGRSGVTGSTGTINMTGGTLNVKTSGIDGNLELGIFDAASGIVNMTSGAIRLYSGANLLLGSQNTSGDGTFTQDGGTVTVYSDAAVTVGGTGALRLGANTNATGNYTYSLNGGTLSVSRINRLSTTGTGTFNFNGGTLRPVALNGDFMSGLTKANVHNNGAIINTAGFDITIAQNLDHSQLIGANSTDGGLTKSGTGILALTGVNTFNGPTTVTGGVLSVNGTSLSDTAALSLTGGAVLDLAASETVNTLTINGASKTAGTYGPTGSGAGTTDDVNFSGTGLLTVLSTGGGGSAYSSWALSKSLTGLNNGPTQDPDSDGIKNLLEFVLGGNPLASDTAKLPLLTTNPTNFVFTFTRDDASKAEAPLTFQYGSNLTGWTDVSIPTTAGVVGIVSVTDNGASPDTITVTLPRSNESSGKLFGRLKSVK